MSEDKPSIATTDSELRRYAADHRFLVGLAAREAGFKDPIVFQHVGYGPYLLKAARRQRIAAIDGVLVRRWNYGPFRRMGPCQIGMSIHEIDGIPFVQVSFSHSAWRDCSGLDFMVVDRAHHARLYRAAVRSFRRSTMDERPPVLPMAQSKLLWDNTVGYLERRNLGEIKSLGGRARRGVLLTGSPGNGKTMACRWIYSECVRRNWEWRIVTPDMYRQARQNDTVNFLFSVNRRGVIFFDDMDLALRDREKGAETDDQAIFLTALDGIRAAEGVVFVFTTNCSLDLLDRAFKRPGRIDVVLQFKPPNATLRRQLMRGWDKKIQDGIDSDAAVKSTDGFSYAEIEELKNLLIMRYVETRKWEWKAVLKQFAENRDDFNANVGRRLGFGAEANGNGVGCAMG